MYYRIDAVLVVTTFPDVQSETKNKNGTNKEPISITKRKGLNRVQGTLLYTGTIYIQADNLCFILFGSFSTHYTCPNINYQLLMTGIACGVSLFVNQKIVSVSSHVMQQTISGQVRLIQVVQHKCLVSDSTARHMWVNSTAMVLFGIFRERAPAIFCALI